MIIIDGTAVQKATAKLRVDSQMHYCWKQERLGEWEPQTSPGAPSAWQCRSIALQVTRDLHMSKHENGDESFCWRARLRFLD